MHQMLISTNYVSLVMLRPKELEIRKKKITTESRKLSQIPQRIELSTREKTLRGI
jgi:hypothetical protein